MGTITSEPSILLQGSFLSIEAESLAICLIIIVVVSQSTCISHVEAIAQVLGKKQSQ